MFAKLVKIKLIELDMDYSTLAAALGCSVQNVSRLLQGDNFREDTMKKIADVLGCDLEIHLTEK